MADFTVRVELRGGSEGDYDALYVAMEKSGYLRIVQADDGSWYQLPSGEFNLRNSDLTVRQVADFAKQVAENIRQGAWVIVTQAVARYWHTDKTK
ncbi:hypothetical protein ACO2Q3_07430 [Caulobacter sp. KR2-114]|uniref:hypothetical protein n=1 Tax=Caulobacter sp. KR2-114 TaxID=3400912 RepID=UPI003C11BCF1